MLHGPRSPQQADPLVISSVVGCDHPAAIRCELIRFDGLRHSRLAGSRTRPASRVEITHGERGPPSGQRSPPRKGARGPHDVRTARNSSNNLSTAHHHCHRVQARAEQQALAATTPLVRADSSDGGLINERILDPCGRLRSLWRNNGPTPSREQYTRRLDAKAPVRYSHAHDGRAASQAPCPLRLLLPHSGRCEALSGTVGT